MKNVLDKLYIYGFPICFVLGIVGVATNLISIIYTAITLSVVYIIYALIIYPIYKKVKYKEELANTNSIVLVHCATHIQGLPATGNEYCSIFVKNEFVEITTNNQKFVIDYDKIYGVVVSANKETIIQNIETTTKHKPSIGKAVVGGALFGTTGAIIGASSGKSKSKSTVNSQEVVKSLYLSINYEGENGSNSIVFEGNPYCNFKTIQNEINNKIKKEDVVSL